MASHCRDRQFWTPNANRRSDEYGGPLVTGCGSASGAGVRERVSGDFIVGVRMTGDDFVEGGLDNAACQEIAGRLDELRLIDYFNIIGSSPETSRGEAACVPDMSSPVALYCPLAASIKAVVRVPVIAVGRINDPAVAERVLAEGQADLCVMTRALIADPDLPGEGAAGSSTTSAVLRLQRGVHRPSCTPAVRHRACVRTP
jgi:2,4-dienoyl-CoA reductase-like NADH-dependent reductase (Old Yellow Enzyme family)